MSTIKWKSYYEVGIPEIDRQHQKLIRIINSVYLGFRNRERLAKLQTALDELIEYSVTHFSCEEALMELHAYPQQEQHLHQHSLFSSWVLKVKTRVVRDGEGLRGSELIYLRQWLIGHVAAEDQKLSRHLRDRGVFEIEPVALPSGTALVEGC